MGQWGNDPGIAELAAVTYPVPNHVLENKSNRSGQKPRPREELSVVKQTGEPIQLMRVPGSLPGTRNTGEPGDMVGSW